MIDPEVTKLLADLARLAAQNGAAAIATKVQAVRATKQHDEIVNELSEIINTLIDEKNQLLTIARGLEQSLVAQRITSEEVDYISATVLPTIKKVAASSDADNTAALKALEPLEPLLSAETITILQTLGFNFKAAIGEPLTELVRRLILSNVPSEDVGEQLQILAAQQNTAFLEVVRDPEAYARLVEERGGGSSSI